jgi:hypothetical protein
VESIPGWFTIWSLASIDPNASEPPKQRSGCKKAALITLGIGVAIVALLAILIIGVCGIGR